MYASLGANLSRYAMLSLRMTAPFLGGGAPGRLAGPGSLQFKVRASGGTFVPEWCAPGACWGCDLLWLWGIRRWSVPEVVIGRGCHDWAVLEETVRKMIESDLEEGSRSAAFISVPI